MKSASFAALLALVTLAGCRRANPEEQAGAANAVPPAAAMARLGESPRLDDRLAELDSLLQEMLSGDFGDEARAGMMRAEALTDRLLEAEPAVQWLASDYSLAARLRQLQALADRIVASIRRGADDQAIRAEVRDLQRQIATLRRELARPGGGPAPPSLDSLLSAVRMDAPAAAEGPGGE